MNLIIIDRDTRIEYWTAEQCAEHCEVSRATWSAYVSRDIAPTASTYLNARTPVWNSESVRDWHSSRPSQA